MSMINMYMNDNRYNILSGIDILNRLGSELCAINDQSTIEEKQDMDKRIFLYIQSIPESNTEIRSRHLGFILFYHTHPSIRSFYIHNFADKAKDHILKLTFRYQVKEEINFNDVQLILRCNKFIPSLLSRELAVVLLAIDPHRTYETIFKRVNDGNLYCGFQYLDATGPDFMVVCNHKDIRIFCRFRNRINNNQLLKNFKKHVHCLKKKEKEKKQKENEYPSCYCIIK